VEGQLTEGELMTLVDHIFISRAELCRFHNDPRSTLPFDLRTETRHHGDETHRMKRRDTSL
jgi:hypothetical protein